MQDLTLLVAHDEFYAPLADASSKGRALRPSGLPAEWSSVAEGVWCHHTPPAVALPECGWKVHVSSTPSRLDHVLDVVAGVCVEQGVAFKHLATDFFFEMFHQKHGFRVQAGKFCAAYPTGVDESRELMRRLDRELADEDGPYVLSDRRFGTSKVVYYRYGAYRMRTRTQPDGRPLHLIRDGNGEYVEDQRRPCFTLPAGMVDPFARPGAANSGERTTLLAGRFKVESVIRHGNSGGTYTARDVQTGETVFVKEARAHNGYGADGADAASRLRREYDVLTAIHEADPGLCPRPVAFFTQWEHAFLVTEFVSGVNLYHWVGINNTLVEMRRSVAERDAYLGRVSKVAAQLRALIDRLHALGMRFGDVSHGNVLIDDKDTIRLIDFETTTRLSEEPVKMATLGFSVPPGLKVDGDDYAVAALTMLLLFPLARPLEADPAGRLALHLRDLEYCGPIPDDLWCQASRHYQAYAETRQESTSRYSVPPVSQLDADPLASLRVLGDGIADGILGMADVQRADWVFPPGPDGFAVNTHCLAHGTAGVVHALLHWGSHVPAEIVRRLRADALTHVGSLSPGLLNGNAGIAWVLTESGLLEEAQHLLDHDSGEPGDDLLGNGRSGIALARLALHEATGDPRHLEKAVAVGEELISEAGIERLRADAGTPGLSEGFSGCAAFLQALWKRTGEARFLRAAVRLMHLELDEAVDDGPGGLRFYDGGGVRVITYLSIGSAGVASMLASLAADSGDERLASALPRVLVPCRSTNSMEPGLFTGVGSWVFALARHAECDGGADAEATAVRVATSLAKYAVRTPTGLRLLGAFEPRYHADLAGGSAGVLIALARLVRGTGAEFFTAEPAGVIVRPSAAAAR